MDVPALSALAAAALAGLAVALALGRPVQARARSVDPSVGDRLPGWMLGRDDAVPWPHRAALGLAVATASGWALRSVAPSAPAAAAVALAVLAGSAATVVLGHLEPTTARRRRWRLTADTPQALDLMSVCLAAGLPLRAALSTVVDVFDGPVSDDLGRVLVLVELGVGDAEAWRSLADHPDLGPAAAELARSVDAGTMMAESLAAHAGEARARRLGEVEVAARRVGVRSVLPLMTCFIPAFLLVGIVPTVVSAVLSAFSF